MQPFSLFRHQGHGPLRLGTDFLVTRPAPMSVQPGASQRCGHMVASKEANSVAPDLKEEEGILAFEDQEAMLGHAPGQEL